MNRFVRSRGVALAAMIAILASPAAVSTAKPAGLLLVLNKSANTMAFVDPESLQVLGTVPTGQGPHEVAVDASGRIAYVANYGTAAEPGSTLSVIDIPSRKVTSTIDLGAFRRPHGIVIAPDGNLWVTCEGSEAVVVVDPKQGKVVRSHRTGQQVTHMIAMTPDGRRAFTANIGSDTVSMIEAETGTVTHVGTGDGPEGIDLSPDRKEIWVAHRGDGGLSILDATSGKLLQSIPKVGEMPIRVKFTPDGRRVLISCARGGEVAVYDAASRSEVARIKTGEVPVGLLIPPGGGRAFVANTMADRVTVLDLKSYEVVGTIAPGREPDGLAWAGF